MRFRNNALLVAAALALSSMLGCISSAHADADQTACINKKVAFDGIEPLKYADVTGEPNSHIPLWHQHQSLCASADDSNCKGKAYLVPGNTVAVANTCGGYAHVQFIGEKVVSYGWALSSQLKERNEKLPFDDGEPGGVDARPQPDRLLDTTIHVKLTKGQGIPVCEAYLQRLNQTVFHEPPFCGRPENDQIPWFARLNRVQLSANKINKLAYRVYNFSTIDFTSFNHVYSYDNLDPEKTGYLDTGGWFKLVKPNDKAPVWKFDPPVDIDNDGTPDNLVIWRGTSWNDECGLKIENTPYGMADRQAGYLLTPDDSAIDGSKTTAIFEHPSGGYFITDGTAPHRKWFKTFRPLGWSISVFKYRNVYYFDTFVDNASQPYESNFYNNWTVFLTKNHQTREICEYTNMDKYWELEE